MVEHNIVLYQHSSALNSGGNKSYNIKQYNIEQAQYQKVQHLIVQNHIG